MAQQGVEQVGLDKHNLARTGRMALYGGCTWLVAGLSYSSSIGRGWAIG